MKWFAILFFVAALYTATGGPAAAAPGLSGEWTCLTYGASINWFQNIWFKGPGHYALGDSKKPFGAGTYRIDSSNVLHFNSGGDKDFLGLYKSGAIYLKFKSDHGPFIKRGIGNLMFKCGPGR